jgi:hypothetical protein
MPFKNLHFVSTRLSSIPEEIGRTRCSVQRASSSNSFDSTANASLVSTRNWSYDGAKSSSFMPKVPTRRTRERIFNDTAPKAPLRRRLSDENLERNTIRPLSARRLHVAAPKALYAQGADEKDQGAYIQRHCTQGPTAEKAI